MSEAHLMFHEAGSTKESRMKIFQVTDDNHSAYLCLANTPEEALEKMTKMHGIGPDEDELQDRQEMRDELKAEGIPDAEIEEQITEEFGSSEWVAWEVQDGASVDNDGPISFND